VKTILERGLDSDFHGTRLNLLKGLQTKLVDLRKLDKVHYQGLLAGEGGKKTPLDADFSEQLSAEMMRLVQDARQFGLLNNWLRTLPSLALLNAFKAEYQSYIEEEQILPLAEFNRLLSEQIKDQPAPFLFERLGTFYRHFLLDEFQDTSVMQWANLSPLIAHPLEGQDEQGEEGTLLLVGDAKQAIYRWRGGNPEQFIDLIFDRTNPFQLAPEQKVLDTNWRSAPAIVEFNNRFFAFLSQFLDLPLHQMLFAEKSQQRPERADHGEVCLSISPDFGRDKEEETQWTLEQLEQQLKQLDADGVPLSDICILTRTNAQARIVAQFLLEREWPLVSADALLIDDHPNVQLLFSILRFLHEPDDQESGYALLLHFAQKEEDLHSFISHHLSNPIAFLEERFGLPAKELHFLGLYEKARLITILLQLYKEGQAYLAAFLEELLQFERKNGNQLGRFIAYWEDIAPKKTLPAPEGIEAIQLMTIHKSKGLEFPVVLFPFADRQSARMHEQQIWVPAAELGKDELFSLPLFCSTDMLAYPESVLPYTSAEWGLQQLDQINVLYVAMTRAQNILHLWSGQSKSPGSGAQLSLGYWLPKFLEKEGVWEEGTSFYRWGKKPLKSADQSTSLSASLHWPFQDSKTAVDRFLKTPAFNLPSKESEKARIWGDLLHRVLAHVNAPDELANALLEVAPDLSKQGISITAIAELLKQVLEHPDLQAYFGPGADGYNEREVLTPQGELLRPDRMVFFDQTVHLLEYKTGKPQEAHREQLRSYAHLLSQMNYQTETLALVYLQDPIEVVFLQD
jgi:ATP-dependent exoDNAse (exonuclease V) beta subunit